MDEKIRKLTFKEFNLLPDKIHKRITGRYILEIDGRTFYGFLTAKDVRQALKPQPYKEVVYKDFINDEGRR